MRQRELPELPPGREVELANRGSTFVRELPGPPGAPSLLLLHGWTVSSDLNWFACYEPLAADFHVVSMDHRGHGRGIRSSHPFTLEDCADDAAALAEELGLEHPILVGYSMGGPIACLAALRHREVFGGVVLCATSARFVQDDLRTHLGSMVVLALTLGARLLPRALLRRLSAQLLREEVGGLPSWALEELERCDPVAAMEAGFALRTYDARPWIDRIDLPAAVVVTDNDAVVRPATQEAMANTLADVSTHHVSGGHIVVASRPEELLGGLRSACSSVVKRMTDR